MGELLISIANDFSRHPGPRYVRQGPNSGERFRRVLVKALRTADRVVVSLDGTSGIGSSFLDEAFGGLIFAEGFSNEELSRRLKIVSRLDESYFATINDSMKRAKATKVAS